MADPHIFDRRLIRVRQSRAARLGPVTFLADRVAVDLIERLSLVLRAFPICVDLGSPSSRLAAMLTQRPGVERVIATAPIERLSHPANVHAIVADEENLPFNDQSINLVVSVLALQHVNDLPGTLVQIRRALQPDGLFLAAMLGGDTLTELRQAFAIAETEVEGGMSPRVAPFTEIRDVGALLQRAGFKLPVTDVERLIVRYATPYALMRELRLMGMTNALHERRRSNLRHATLMHAAEIYAERFSNPDGRVRATFDILWLSGWAEHESQQKPLQPGSAKTRLADALGVQENSAGEKTSG